MPVVAQPQRLEPIPFVRERAPLGSLLAYNRDRLGFCERVFSTCGDVGGFHFGPLRVVLLSASDDVQRVLVESSSDFGISKLVRAAFRPLAANGLLTSEGDLHRRQRKVMAPLFQPRQIRHYADTMVQYGERLQSEWADGTTVDASRQMTQVTMSIVGKVLFDADVFTEADELGAAMATVLEHVNYLLSHVFPIPFSWPLPRNRRTRQAAATLKSRIQEMIDARRASSEEKDDLLSTLLKARDEEDGGNMTDQQVYDEALTLFFAGHETIASALTWAWYLLATHPDSLAQLQQEVDAVLGGRPPSADDLAQLPFTLQVLKETLRIFPPIHAIVRVARRDLEVGRFQFRRGDTALISPYVIHHRPDYFPDPQRFDPGRFAPERERQLPRFAFLPFGSGPRICIGNHFALMEGQLLLATLAQRVTFELVAAQRVESDPKVTLRPKFGVKMVVRRRG